MVPNALARCAPAGSHPATTFPEDCPFGRTRETLPCASAVSGLLGTTTTLPASGLAISSMTLLSTVNRSARMTAAEPCNASRLPAATTAAGPTPVTHQCALRSHDLYVYLRLHRRQPITNFNCSQPLERPANHPQHQIRERAGPRGWRTGVTVWSPQPRSSP